MGKVCYFISAEIRVIGNRLQVCGLVLGGQLLQDKAWVKEGRENFTCWGNLPGKEFRK